MKHSAIFVLLSLCCLASQAQNVKVEFFTPQSVRIVKVADGVSINEVANEKKSLSVIASPAKVKVSVSKKGDVTKYKSSELTVTVTGDKVAFYDKKGTFLTTDGGTTYTPITSGPDQGAYKVRTAFSLDADEGLYGIGLLQNGKMSQRGENRLMIQQNLDDYAHFYQTIKGYGIFWDNYSPTQITTPAQGEAGNVVLESQVGKLADYYFMYGGNADGVIREMRHLTGKVPMLALWTYGFHQSRERYESSSQLLEVVNRYRKDGIPFDGIIQDWQYWGSNYTWNAMEFLNPNFSNAQQMIDEVHKKNAKLHISIWASFGKETKQYRDLAAKNLLFDFQTWPQSGLSQWPPRMDYPSGVRVYDPYSSEARDIYWRYLSKMHTMGIDGWWMDSTDPDHLDFHDSDLDQKSSMGCLRSVRNAFPLMTVGGVFDHQRAVDSLKRVFILTRSYFTGQQRYGANTWSGDVGSSWESLRKQVPICLNYTLTGNPNVNTDIGGFFAGSYNTKGHNSATRNPQFQELYVRWMQFGVFCPMMRSHGTEVYREIYHYGKPGEPVYDALKSAIELRYRLLPYIYSTSWQVSNNDDSFMRALMMDFPKDKNTWDNNKQYMFGRNILVCAVVDPLFTKEKVVKTDAMSGWNKQEDMGNNNDNEETGWNVNHSYNVYLPAGAKWYDYWTGNLLDGGQTIAADAPISHSPLFVKAGSIIPMGPAVQYSNEKAWDNLDIVIYPGADTDFTLYEDEFDNYNYEKGAYTTINLHWNDKARTLTIGNRKGVYDGMLTQRKFNVKLVNTPSTITVNYNGKVTKCRL